jgi:hypothetical protein
LCWWLVGCKGGGRPDRHDDIDVLPHQVRREFLQALRVTFREFALDDDVLTLEIAEFSSFPMKGAMKKVLPPVLSSPIRKGCCACTASGQATATPPRSVMNSRLRIRPMSSAFA